MATKLNLLVLLTVVLLLVLYKSHNIHAEFSKLNVAYADQYISTNQSNEIVVFTPSLSNGRKNYYNAGLGFNTLWLRLTPDELENPVVEADILRFYYFLLNRSDPFHVTEDEPVFKFSAFHLTVKNFENFIIERIKEPIGIKKKPLKIQYFRTIHDSSVDSMS